jgi:NADH dehydrogenase FAD-containing subunit
MQREETDYTDILIIGGGYAGRYAAARARTRDPNLSITLVDPNDGAIQRARSHEAAAARNPTARSWSSLLPADIRVIQGRADKIDPSRRRCRVVAVRDDTQPHRTLAYRALIVATGSRVSMLPTDNSVPSYAVDDPTLGQHARRARSFTVIGAGLSGVEVACELRERFDVPVELVAPDILPASSQKAAVYARQRTDELGIQHVTARADCIRDHALHLVGGTRRSVDSIICANGFDCESPFDVPRRPANTLQDEVFPDIFYAGDQLAGYRHEKAFHPSCALAIPSGVHAAENAIRFLQGQPLEPFRFGTLFRLISIGRRDGIIDRTRLDGTPRNSIITGRLAAFAKERILRMTDWALRLELFTGWPIYRWPEPSEPAALPDAPLSRRRELPR